ncbi:tetratricopeptide repeat protein [Sorangium sp. So ce1335]|uniref:tetratricopeptide repeat protein n=1 Tax=Sorangium sp. So ce1335 TaxID=3133335 RepID=UPI003F62A7F3
MEMRRGLLFLGAGALLGAVTLSGAASAQRAQDAVKPMAEALFWQGRDLFKRGQYPEACDKFEESQRLEPKPGTLLNLAVCHEQVGKLATAWAELGSVEEVARREGPAEREAFARARREALEQRLARIEIRMDAPPASLRLTIDGEPLNGAALSAPFPIDPGRHRVAAAAPGKKAWSTAVDVPPERAAIVVTIPALEDAPPATGAPATGAPATGAPATGAPLAAPRAAGAPQPQAAPAGVPAGALAPRATGAPQRPEPPADGAGKVLMAMGFSVGAVGLMVGAVAGALTLSRSGALAEVCENDRCPPSRRGDLSTAKALANVSNAGFAVLAVGAGVGVAGLLMLPSRAAAAGPRAALTPALGAGIMGLQVSF